MAADLQICAGLLESSQSSTVLSVLRQFFRRKREEHPDAFPKPLEFSTQERLILDAVDDGACSIEDIVAFTGYQEVAARRLLKTLVLRGVLEVRKLAKTEAARGKTPEIWVRVGSPAGNAFDARPSARAARAD